MPTFLANLILPAWAKKALLIAGAAALAIAVFMWWLDSYGDGRVADDRAGAEVVVGQATSAANAAAAETDRINAVDNAIAAERADRAIAEAQASHPAEVKRQAGPATRAVLEQLGRR